MLSVIRLQAVRDQSDRPHASVTRPSAPMAQGRPIRASRTPPHRPFTSEKFATPKIVARKTFQAELDALRVRQKATRTRATLLQPRAGAFPWLKLTRPRRWLEKGERWRFSTPSRGAECSSPTTSCGIPAAPRLSSVKDATWVTSQVCQLSYLHHRNVTFAVFCQGPIRGERPLPELPGTLTAERVTSCARRSFYGGALRRMRRPRRSIDSCARPR